MSSVRHVSQAASIAGFLFTISCSISSKCAITLAALMYIISSLFFPSVRCDDCYCDPRILRFTICTRF